MKWVTSGLVALGVLSLTLTLAVLSQAPGVDATRREKVQYGVRMMTLFGVTSGLWLGAAASAVILARRARKEYADERQAALEGLVEGSLRDHIKRD